MKKLIIVLLILTLLLFTSCTHKTTNVNDNTSDIVESNSQETNSGSTINKPIENDRLNGIDVEPVNHNNVKIWPDGVKLGFSSDFQDLYNYDFFGHKAWERQRFVDDSVEKSLEMTILGTEYTLLYEESENWPLSNYIMHKYNFKDKLIDRLQLSSVYIDSKTGKVLKYVGIPLNEDIILTTEQDYLNWIKDMIGNEFDFSNCKYESYTLYYDSNSNNESVNEFREIQEGERLRLYEFLFAKLIDGVQTNEHVHVRIWGTSNTVDLEVWNFDYKAETFAQTISHMDGFEDYLKEYINSKLLPGYEINTMEFNVHQLFVKDNIVYVSSVVNMEVMKTGKHFEYSQHTIVSKLNPI